jgi:hypothetical protein
MISRLLLALAMSALLGCSSAMRVERARDLGATKYKHLVVAIGVDDIPLRKLAEESFAGERATQADIVPSTSLLESNRGYEPDEIERAFRAINADAVAIITPNGAGRENVVYATNIHPGRVCGFGTKLGCIYGASVRVKSEGARPWVNFNVELYEMSTGRLMWTADVRTSGRPNETSISILHRLARDVVHAWEKDGVLARSETIARR